MAITERKAVALDSAVDLIFILYGVSDIQPIKPLKWLRGDIKTEKSTKLTVEVRIEFWPFGDPNCVIDVSIALNYQHVFGTTYVWTPNVATVTTITSTESHWVYKDKGWVKA